MSAIDLFAFCFLSVFFGVGYYFCVKRGLRCVDASVSPIVLELLQRHVVEIEKSGIQAALSRASADYLVLFYNRPNVRKALEKQYATPEEKDAVMRQIKEAGDQGLAELRKEIIACLTPSKP